LAASGLNWTSVRLFTEFADVSQRLAGADAGSLAKRSVAGDDAGRIGAHCT